MGKALFLDYSYERMSENQSADVRSATDVGKEPSLKITLQRAYLYAAVCAEDLLHRLQYNLDDADKDLAHRLQLGAKLELSQQARLSNLVKSDRFKK